MVMKGQILTQELLTRPVSRNQFDALVSFTYNLGAGALRGSTLLKLLNAGNIKRRCG